MDLNEDYNSDDSKTKNDNFDILTSNPNPNSKVKGDSSEDAKLIKMHCDKNNISRSKIKIVRKTIGFVSEEKSHPLDHIYFINKKNRAIKIPKDNISMCVPFTHVEQVTIIYKLTNNLCSK